ncbi:MAG: hypothetical protein F6K62_02975 [Sphaerospermopsis sp. SIO1G2]|nr:hypothetical protein [Sphaerospermopsis sp. SIO1G1]NET70030.1 hypothetical protein [Sphaerospermopsis sp. SIO1G2]
MNFRHWTKYLVAGLACSSFLATTGQSVLGNSSPDKRTKTAPTMQFICESKSDDTYETWVQGLKSGKKKGPLFVWKDQHYKDWPPQRRCNHVTQKLNQRYKENGYYMAGLGVKTGIIDQEEGIYRICLLNDYMTCGSKTQLFQIRPQNNKNQQGKPEEMKSTAKDITLKVEGVIKSLGGKVPAPPIQQSSESDEWIPLEVLDDVIE